jgi:photosystem II stability/assembly factor-like uncharacterized protein
MMRVLTTALVVFFSITGVRTSSFAESGWFWQHPLPQGSHLQAAATPGPNIIVAVGFDGTILRSTDGGTSWTLQETGTTAALFAVSFVDANTGWAVGFGIFNSESPISPILHTTDGGASWTHQHSGTIQALRGVSFVDGPDPISWTG